MNVHVVLTTSSKTVGARSMRPAPIDRTERIEQHGAGLAQRPGDFSARALEAR
jgi:hypothetical protein